TSNCRARRVSAAASTTRSRDAAPANANYARIDTDHGVDDYIVEHSHAAPGRHSVDGRYRLSDFPGVTEASNRKRFLRAL
ncbi:MAG TPA: hypothetical protein VKE42_02230, partial [Candidatus Cybelea sp.]|nr:hypothetical protein [Candidatus Cybelea sp.]